MAALSFVFLVRVHPGGYALGAGLAGAYVVGEVVGAPILGMRLRPERARAQLMGGLAVGAAAFAGLGAFPAMPPILQAVLAVLAGGAPAAAPGGLRTVLTEQVDDGLVARALSAEATLTLVVWAVAPAVTGALAIGVAARAPMLVAAALMAAAAAGLRGLPRGWKVDTADRKGHSMIRTLMKAWPILLSGAAGNALLALAELVLPPLLEQRGITVGWAGPLLAGYSLASAFGAFLYGLRTWPGRLHVQSVALLVCVSGCVAVVGLVSGLGWIALALLIAGLLESGVMVSRSLGLRAVLPQSVLAAGFSLMYAMSGVGYAASASLSGIALSVTSPSVTILCGVTLTLLLTVASAVGERGLVRNATPLNVDHDIPESVPPAAEADV